MLIQEIEREQRKDRGFTVGMAQSEAEVREAQRLRYRVFAKEMGARLHAERRLDEDQFDSFCNHLLVREDDSGEVIGTYRILPPAAARQIGRLYSEHEFDLGRLAHLRPSLVELGRSCIHPAFRTGSVIALLWAGLARYVLQNDYAYLVGCASMGMVDGGTNASAVYRKLSATNIAPPEYRVFPHNVLPLRDTDSVESVVVPPLIKGYMRLGAYVCGEPAWDPDFDTADLFVLLPVARIGERYARHFLGDARRNLAREPV